MNRWLRRESFGLCEIGGSRKSHAFFAMPQTVTVLLHPFILRKCSNGSCVAPPKHTAPQSKALHPGTSCQEKIGSFWGCVLLFLWCTNKYLPESTTGSGTVLPLSHFPNNVVMTTKMQATSVVQCWECYSICQDMYVSDKEEKKECNLTEPKLRAKLQRERFCIFASQWTTCSNQFLVCLLMYQRARQFDMCVTSLVRT
jgi:hypothetical protein